MGKMTKKKNWGVYFYEMDLRRREYGFKRKLDSESNFMYSLYASLNPCKPDPKEVYRAADSYSPFVDHGGIFNFAFSPDGRQLTAACECKSLLFYDPISQKQINNVQEAHSGCVNCVKYLDTRLFATCSDDNTVALWDVRNLRRRIQVLKGHRNWVKSIEYSPEDGMLVTAGLDNRILGWNINQFSRSNEGETTYTELFKMEGLMRIRFNPDASKLILCTTEGYMIIIHDLDLSTLASDLKGFQPNVYRVMQLAKTPLPNQASMTPLFFRKRNRVEFITDFPAGNKAEVIQSLQVHPQGWCVLSRNTSAENSSEWTCVHDIQEINHSDTYVDEITIPYYNEEDESPPPSFTNSLRYQNDDLRSSRHLDTRRRRRQVVHVSSANNIPRHLITLPESSQDALNTFPNSDDEEESMERMGNLRNNSFSEGGREEFEGAGSSVQVTVTSLGILEALQHIGLMRLAEWRRMERLRENFSFNRYFNSQFSVRSRSREDYVNTRFVVEKDQSLPYNNYRDVIDGITYKIAKNSLRLTNYIEELNRTRGFIKELCFSSDGRLICSPYGKGVRLLMFNDKCSELSHCVQSQPQALYPVSTNICHSRCVVCTQFSPTDCLLVSGCLDGEIVWHRPYL